MNSVCYWRHVFSWLNEIPERASSTGTSGDQQGELLAKNLIRMEKGQEMKPFHYRNLGSMATVGVPIVP